MAKVLVWLANRHVGLVLCQWKVVCLMEGGSGRGRNIGLEQFGGVCVRRGDTYVHILQSVF